MTKLIWVVETGLSFATLPRVREYTGIAVTKGGVKVLIRGNPTFIPKATGRRFFTERWAMDEYLFQWLSFRLESLKRQVQEISDAVSTLPPRVPVTKFPSAPPRRRKLILK